MPFFFLEERECYLQLPFFCYLRLPGCLSSIYVAETSQTVESLNWKNHMNLKKHSWSSNPSAQWSCSWESKFKVSTTGQPVCNFFSTYVVETGWEELKALFFTFASELLLLFITNILFNALFPLDIVTLQKMMGPCWIHHLPLSATDETFLKDNF